MESSVIDLFWALLRAGLWGGSALLPEAFRSVQPTDKQWRDIYAIASRQAVLGVIYDGILSLPANQQPSQEILRHFFQRVLLIEKANTKLNEALASLVGRYDEAGIPSMLLKGQGVAQNYPNPLHRQCGDIDLFVGEKNYKRACDMARGWLPDGEQIAESAKHAHFDLNGATIELHRYTSILPSGKYNKLYKQWTEEVFAKPRSGFNPVGIDGVKVTVPPMEYNIIYVFYHFFHHFFTSGVGMRQLCDWVCLLNKAYPFIKEELLRDKLQSFGLLGPWQVFGDVVVTYFGLPQGKFPCFSPLYGMEADKVIEMIAAEGNFGKSRSVFINRPKGYLAGKLFSFGHTFVRLCKLTILFPHYARLHMTQFVIIGVGQVFRDLRARSK